MARIGVMGCGTVADYGHIPAILQTPGLELVALFDPSEERVKSEAAKFNINRWYTDQDQFLDSGLDAVVVSSIAPAHKQNVLGAAKRKHHVLCEKPLALTDEDSEEMIEAMHVADRMLLVGFVYRYSPIAQQIKKWVEDGLVGEIKSLRLIYIWDYHGQFMQDNGKWVESPRWRGRMEEGGPLIDCGVHQIDLARWWLGQEVVRFAGEGAWVSTYKAPDHSILNMDHELGAHTLVEVAASYGHTARNPREEFSYHLIGTGGVIRYDRDGWLLEARTGTDHITAPGASEKNFPGMYAAFAEALKTGKPGSFPTGRDGLIATQIAEKATAEVIDRRERLQLQTKPTLKIANR